MSMLLLLSRIISRTKSFVMQSEGVLRGKYVGFNRLSWMIMRYSAGVKWREEIHWYVVRHMRDCCIGES